MVQNPYKHIKFRDGISQSDINYYKLLKFFISFVTTVKSHHTPTISKKLRWKSLCLLILKSITEIINILRVYMILGDAVLKLETLYGFWTINMYMYQGS